MAGLIAALFGGRKRPPLPDPLPGEGGYAMPPGPTGQGGYPGSTTLTRIVPRNPRAAKLRTDKIGSPDLALSGNESRQESYRADTQGIHKQSPRNTSRVVTPGQRERKTMQENSPGEFYGGQYLRTQTGMNDNVGLNPLGHDGIPSNSTRHTETPATKRQPDIGIGTPGSNNVRNTWAQRYLNRPGQMHTYRSAPRGEQPVVSDVTVPNRYVWDQGGSQTWSVQRQMPYTGRGNGARGADLSGQRYYAPWQSPGFQFVNAGAGDYGVSRLRGGDRKRPVSFTEPAPWTGQYYDTTPDMADAGQGGPGGNVHVSPQTGRASTRVKRG